MNLKIYLENTLAALLRDHWWGRRSIAARHPPCGRVAVYCDRRFGRNKLRPSHGGARRPAEPPAIRRSGESTASPNEDTPTHAQTTSR